MKMKMTKKLSEHEDKDQHKINRREDEEDKEYREEEKMKKTKKRKM